MIYHLNVIIIPRDKEEKISSDRVETVSKAYNKAN
jgi:hypothetical protein